MSLSIEQTLTHILEQEWGITVEHIELLSGYSNCNYAVDSKQQRYILKTYAYTEDQHELIVAENEVLLGLAENLKPHVPLPIIKNDNTYVSVLHINDEPQILRVLSYLPGEFIGHIKESPKSLTTLGTFIARIHQELNTIKHPVYKARQFSWDINHLHLNEPLIEHISSMRDQNNVRYFFQQFDQHVRPVIASLQHSLIHNDINEWNILTDQQQVSGLIDWGDMTYSARINDLAIAITYACYTKQKPLQWACLIIKAYNQIISLDEVELSILYYLIAARLCTSVCNSAYAKKQKTDDAYLTISEKPAWNMLYLWLTISPQQAENTFREAVGLASKPQPPIENALEKRQQHFSPLLSVSYQRPIYLQKAAFQYMYDVYGNTLLDAYNNIPHVGHCHPTVVEAGQSQMAQLNTNTRYIYDIMADYAEQLLARFPDSLDTVYFVNSGSAASDLVVRIAKAHTQNQHMMVMQHGYHGNTQSSIDISDYKFSNPKGQGQKQDVLVAEIPDAYRGRFAQHAEAGKQYVQVAIENIERYAHPIAAFISEPVVGCGGQVPLADGYLQHIYLAIRAQGGVCISDEVQTGFGRLGDHFWGFEAQKVIPDAVIIGKPMANGHPMAAVICTREMAQSFAKGVEFFSSFGGNPVSCAIAQSVLQVIDDEQLQRNAKTTGDFYKAQLRALQKKYACIGDVRGSGLFLGIEIVEDGSNIADHNLASHIKNAMRERHILISTDGPHDSVIKTKPPIIFTEENARAVTENLNDILYAHYSQK